MNQNGPSDNVASDRPMSGLAKLFFVAWIVATMVVYFLAFGTRYVVSLFRRIRLRPLFRWRGLESLFKWMGLEVVDNWLQWFLELVSEWLQVLSDGLMTWFSTRGG